MQQSKPVRCASEREPLVLEVACVHEVPVLVPSRTQPNRACLGRP
jgi:hypothetical protein